MKLNAADDIHDMEPDGDDVEKRNLENEKRVSVPSFQASTDDLAMIFDSNEEKDLRELVKTVKSHPFLRNRAKSFAKARIVTTYQCEEGISLKNLATVPRSGVRRKPGITDNHAVYRIKCNDDNSFALKCV